MNWNELFGFIGGLLTTISMIPQLWRLIKFKSAKEISLIFTVSFTLGIFFWLLYGILFKMPAVIFWNSTALVLGIGLVWAKLKWGGK